MHETGDLSVCGWRVRSEVPLPELLPWTGEDREPDVVFRLGAVPAVVDSPRFVGRRLQVGEDGSCRYEHPVAGAVLVRGGREVIASPAPEVSPELLAAVLLGPALAILAHERGLLPLHACCVEVEGRAVAITGAAGAGKSTLAMAFVHAGHRMLADDLTLVDPGVDATPGRPMALPVLARLKLTPEMLALFGADQRELRRSVTRLDKLQLPVPGAFQPSALPLHAIYEIVWPAERGRGAIERVGGTAALAALTSALYARAVARRTGDRRQLFEQMSRVVAGVSGVYRLLPERGRPGLEKLVARVVCETLGADSSLI